MHLPLLLRYGSFLPHFSISAPRPLKPQGSSKGLPRKVKGLAEATADARLTPGGGHRLKERLSPPILWGPTGAPPTTLLLAAAAISDSGFRIPGRTASGGTGSPTGTLSGTDCRTDGGQSRVRKVIQNPDAQV